MVILLFFTFFEKIIIINLCPHDINSCWKYGKHNNYLRANVPTCTRINRFSCNTIQYN